MVKFYSKESNMVAIHAIPGHFATSHSHINYYIDITSLKTRIQEAKEVARVLHQKKMCIRDRSCDAQTDLEYLNGGSGRAENDSFSVLP